MRVGRVRGSSVIEARSGVRRMQRALAAREAQVARDRLELSEQFQNLVATMREMSILTAQHAETLEDLVLHQGGRFNVLARVHGLLLRDGAVELETLAWDELSAAVSPCESDRIVIGGPPVMLDRSTAELLALALHELTTNAIKFGALADDAGRIEVTWSVEAGPKNSVRLSWAEMDAPPPAQLPTHRGFGRELVETVLPRRLGAETRFAITAAGLRCDIRAPFEAIAQGERTVLAAAA